MTIIVNVIYYLMYQMPLYKRLIDYSLVSEDLCNWVIQL